jgi:PAS domain S-box-containing protein
MLFRAVPRMKKQIALMIIGSWGPFGFTLIYLSGVIYMPIDISPFGFLFSGVFYMWGIYQFNMLRLAPLALQQMFESMEDAVIILDTDNSLTSFNRSAKNVVSGLSNKSAGQPAAQVFSRYPLLLEIIVQGGDSAATIQLVSPDGNVYNVHRSPVLNRRHKIVGTMLLLRDVTEAVHAEEKLRDNARQLSELNMFKDRLFSVVAHDIRDPLAVLVNLMELLEEEIQAEREDHEELIHEMGQQIQNTFALVEVLLDWFRSQREGMIFNPVKRDLASAVQAGLRLQRLRSDHKRIQIISDIPEATYVYADKEMLDLIIRNLLSNAIKFSYRGGCITLKAEQVEHHMVIAVSDTGGGISPEQADTLLQDDYRHSTDGTSGERGVGLGLTLCREFVQLNGGELWFDSQPSMGSIFYFSLPLPPEAPLILAGNSTGKG